METMAIPWETSEEKAPRRPYVFGPLFMAFTLIFATSTTYFFTTVREMVCLGSIFLTFDEVKM